MAIVPTKELFEHAYGKYAVGAYNINNAEQVMGLFRGNLGKLNSPDDPVDKELAAPFIVQLSKGAREYTNKKLLESMIRAADEIFPEAVFAVHLDHGDEQTCYDCIDSGFYSSVMIDASAEKFAKNIEITKRVVERAHAKGISVEAELGKLGGVEEHVKVAESDAKLTNPNQVYEFVEKSGCDSLACAIGTSHGAYKFTGTQGLHFDVIEKIAELLPGYPLVMHGSSSVPAEEVVRIEKAGGYMRSVGPNGEITYAKGVSEEDISKAAPMGVTKVNIDTDGRLVWFRTHLEHFREKPDVFDLRKPGKVFMGEYAKYIAHKNKVLGSAGKLEEVVKAL
jgi:fructose-bisphosphate aldolase class II